MTSIYFNYLMKPWAKEANRCRAGTISRSLKDPCNVSTHSQGGGGCVCGGGVEARGGEIWPWPNRRMGPFQRAALSHGGGLAITEPQRGLCGAEDDLWVLEGQQAAIMLPWHLFKLPPPSPLLLWMFSFFFLQGGDEGGLEFEADVQRR